MATEKIPLVSVIVPMFNAAKFISQGLESLLYQTMQDFEVLVVDDFSTDNSLEVVESFKEKFGERLRIINLPKNTGMPGLTRNVGIQSARGKYIAFLDANDLFTKTALEELSTLAEESQADVVHLKDSFRLFKGKKISVDDPRLTDFGALTNPKNFSFTEWRRPVLPRPKPLEAPALEPEYLAPRLNSWVKWKYRLDACANFCRREFLISNQIFFPEMPELEAHVFNFACLCLAKNFLCAPNVVYIARPRIDLNEGDNVQAVEKYFHKWLAVLNVGFNELEKFMDRISFFQNQMNYRYAVVGFFFRYVIDCEIIRKYPADYSPLIYQISKEAFKADNAALTAYLFNIINVQRLQLMKAQKEKDSARQAEEHELKRAPSTSEEKIPLVSIVIPMFNSAKFISQTLESLLYQTLIDFEVIVVDDCSTDNGVEVVESFKKKFADFLGVKLTVIKLSQNTGTPGLPRNIGIQFARGKYVAFLDSDDLFTKTALEELSTLAENYSADVVRLQKNFVLWEGKSRSADDPLMTNFEELTNPKNLTAVLRSDKIVDAPTLETEDISKRINEWLGSATKNFWAAGLLFWRREFLTDNKILFSDIYTCEDAPFAFEGLCLAEKFLVAPNCVYIVRPRENSLFQTTTEAALENNLHKRIGSMKNLLGEIERITSKIPLLAKNAAYRRAVSDWFINYGFSLTKNIYEKHSISELNEIIKREFKPADAIFGAYMFNAVNLQLSEIAELEKKVAELEEIEKIRTSTPRNLFY